MLFFGINLALRATRRGPPPGGSGEEGKSAQAADGRRDKAKSKRAEQAVRTRRHSIIIRASAGGSIWHSPLRLKGASGGQCQRTCPRHVSIS